MFITIQTTYCFDPVKEHQALKNFESRNDMREWVKSESTVLVCYTHTERSVVTLREENGQ